MANRRRDLEKEQFWRLVLDEQRDSGLNVREFCRRESVAESAFYAWRKELTKRDRGDSRPIQQAAAQAKRTDTKPRKLVPVGVVDQREVRFRADQVAATQKVEIVTPEGWLLRLASSIEPAQLGALLDVIAGRESARRTEPAAC